MEDRRQFGMKLSVDLIARVDEARGPMSRTAFVERALKRFLNDDPSARLLADVPRTEADPRGADRAARTMKPKTHVSTLPTMAEMKAKRAEERRNG